MVRLPEVQMAKQKRKVMHRAKGRQAVVTVVPQGLSTFTSPWEVARPQARGRQGRRRKGLPLLRCFAFGLVNKKPVILEAEITYKQVNHTPIHHREGDIQFSMNEGR